MSERGRRCHEGRITDQIRACGFCTVTGTAAAVLRGGCRLGGMWKAAALAACFDDDGYADACAGGASSGSLPGAAGEREGRIATASGCHS